MERSEGFAQEQRGRSTERRQKSRSRSPSPRRSIPARSSSMQKSLFIMSRLERLNSDQLECIYLAVKQFTTHPSSFRPKSTHHSSTRSKASPVLRKREKWEGASDQPGTSGGGGHRVMARPPFRSDPPPQPHPPLSLQEMRPESDDDIEIIQIVHPA